MDNETTYKNTVATQKKRFCITLYYKITARKSAFSEPKNVTVN